MQPDEKTMQNANQQIKNTDEAYRLGCEALRMAGYKLTPCRRFVLRNVIDVHGPHSVQTLLEQAGDDSGIDQSTLYRTLETLTGLDMLEVVRLPGKRQTYYVWKHQDYHNHVVCRKCGKVVHQEILGKEELQEKVRQATGFTDIHFHLDFSGICQNCSE